MLCPHCHTDNVDGKCSCRGSSRALDDELYPNSERKHITALFSDMSDYTAITERLDPEETREMMGKIFGQISDVVSKYDGFIEKFIGDAVVALFGVPKSHEDDPVRAIKAAREIHELVSAISPRYEPRIGKPLAMHTGICTGLVVTGDVNEQGVHGVWGTTINTTARLSGSAASGQIVVDADTYRQAEGYFTFDRLGPLVVKGKAEPITAYQVLSPRADPTKTHRLSGMRADLVGRGGEMATLQHAAEQLRHGKGSIVSVVGAAGTGKSRLIEEFRATLNQREIQWREGHCYAYAQNIPYFCLIDLLSRAWQIHENDSREVVRQKVESGVAAVLGNGEGVTPYIGSLYSLSYPEIENLAPELCKSRVHAGVLAILSRLAERAPTVICLEDQHWADASSVELLRSILDGFKLPALFICACRPPFSLLSTEQRAALGEAHHGIELDDLSAAAAQTMVQSLLKTDRIPAELERFIRTKVEGNPFYLEEATNSLIESGTLVRDDENWRLAKSMTETVVPSTIQGIVAARLDRLERPAKRVLQDAAVIGRTFPYQILVRIAERTDEVDDALAVLERLDFIRARESADVEYVFKHALTQEVAYASLLIKKRKASHQRVGQAIEQISKDRLEEFYETLAYHYSRSDNADRAYQYLTLSGEKATKNHSHPEAVGLHKDAIRALDVQGQTTDIKRKKMGVYLSLFVSLTVLHYPEGSSEIFAEAERLAHDLDDQRSLARVYSWWSYYHSVKIGDLRLGTMYADKSYRAAEKVEDVKMMAVCAPDLCLAHWGGNDFGKVVEIGRRMLPLLETHQLENEFFGRWLTVYSAVTGYYGSALAFLGDFEAGKDALASCFVRACAINDKFGMGWVRLNQSGLSIWEGDAQAAIENAQEAIKYFGDARVEYMLGMSWAFLGMGKYFVGEYDAAKKDAEHGLERQKEKGVPIMLPVNYWILAFIYLASNDVARSSDCSQQALKLSREFKTKGFEGLALMTCGVTMAADGPGETDENDSRLRRGIAVCDELKMRSVSALGHLLLGERLSGCGRHEEAVLELQKARALYEEMKVTPRSYWRTRAEQALAGAQSKAQSRV